MKQHFIIGVLVKNKHCLIKQRLFWKETQFTKGLRSRYEEEVFFPKGIIRENESVEQALERSVKTDFGVAITHSSFLGEFLYRDSTNAKVFLIDNWSGDLRGLRGEEKFIWAKKPDKLTNEFDLNIFALIKKRLES